MTKLDSLKLFIAISFIICIGSYCFGLADAQATPISTTNQAKQAMIGYSGDRPEAIILKDWVNITANGDSLPALMSHIVRAYPDNDTITHKIYVHIDAMIDVSYSTYEYDSTVVLGNDTIYRDFKILRMP